MMDRLLAHEESSDHERRQRDLGDAIASVAMEGMTVRAWYNEEAERVAAREIDFDMLASRAHGFARAR